MTYKYKKENEMTYNMTIITSIYDLCVMIVIAHFMSRKICHQMNKSLALYVAYYPTTPY